MWGKSAVGGTASKSQGGFFYPLDFIVVVSYFLVVDWCLAKLVAVCLKYWQRLFVQATFFVFVFLFQNIGKDCLFRPRGDKLPFFCYLSIVASREERIQVILIF